VLHLVFDLEATLSQLEDSCGKLRYSRVENLWQFDGLASFAGLAEHFENHIGLGYGLTPRPLSEYKALLRWRGWIVSPQSPAHSSPFSRREAAR
jgi:hypothetical protein